MIVEKTESLPLVGLFPAGTGTEGLAGSPLPPPPIVIGYAEAHKVISSADLGEVQEGAE